MRLSSGILVGALGIAFAALGARDATTAASGSVLVRSVGGEVRWPFALDFLSADLVQRWAAAELGRDGI